MGRETLAHSIQVHSQLRPHSRPFVRHYSKPKNRMRIHHIIRELPLAGGEKNDQGVDVGGIIDAISKIVKNLRVLGLANDVRDLDKHRDRVVQELDISEDIMDAILSLPSVRAAVLGLPRIHHRPLRGGQNEESSISNTVASLQRSARIQAVINVLLLAFIISAFYCIDTMDLSPRKLIMGIRASIMEILLEKVPSITRRVYSSASQVFMSM